MKDRAVFKLSEQFCVVLFIYLSKLRMIHNCTYKWYMYELYVLHIYFVRFIYCQLFLKITGVGYILIVYVLNVSLWMSLLYPLIHYSLICIVSFEIEMINEHEFTILCDAHFYDGRFNFIIGHSMIVWMIRCFICRCNIWKSVTQHWLQYHNHVEQQQTHKNNDIPLGWQSK